MLLIYYILGNKIDNYFFVVVIYELFYIMEVDDINIVYSCEIEVEIEEENIENIISFIKNYLVFLYDIFLKVELIMDRICVDDEKVREIEECI